jgi:hypothetical protein
MPLPCWLEQGRTQVAPAFRVARLGEFSPFGQLFSLGSFLNSEEAVKCFVLLYPTVKVVH